MALTYNSTLVEGFTYIPESQRDEKDPFSVKIVPIDSVRLTRLEDGLLKRDSKNNMSISTGTYYISLLEASITGWENMLDEKGAQLKSVLNAEGFLAPVSIGKLPTTLITELAGVVLSCSQDPANIQIFTAQD